MNEIMRDMADGDPVVVAAKYVDRMQEFLGANAGLERRFGFRFYFKDYSAAEIAQIFVTKARGAPPRPSRQRVPLRASPPPAHALRRRLGLGLVRQAFHRENDEGKKTFPNGMRDWQEDGPDAVDGPNGLTRPAWLGRRSA